MKVVSYNRSAGRRAKEKVHQIDQAIEVGYMRNGMTGKTLPGSVISLYIDGRLYSIELDDIDTHNLLGNLRSVATHLMVK